MHLPGFPVEIQPESANTFYVLNRIAEKPKAVLHFDNVPEQAPEQSRFL